MAEEQLFLLPVSIIWDLTLSLTGTALVVFFRDDDTIPPIPHNYIISSAYSIFLYHGPCQFNFPWLKYLLSLLHFSVANQPTTFSVFAKQAELCQMWTLLNAERHMLMNCLQFVASMFLNSFGMLNNILERKHSWKIKTNPGKTFWSMMSCFLNTGYH